LFQSSVLFFDLAQAAQLSHAHAGELALPAIKRLFGDAGFATDLNHRCPSFGLPQGIDHLFFRERPSRHR